MVTTANFDFLRAHDPTLVRLGGLAERYFRDDPATALVKLRQFIGACRKVFGVYPALSMRAAYAPPNRRWPMLLNALVEKLKRRSKDDFKGRHYEATLILQAVSWYLRYPLSYRDIEELFREPGLEVDHITAARKDGLLARVPVHYVTK